VLKYVPLQVHTVRLRLLLATLLLAAILLIPGQASPQRGNGASNGFPASASLGISGIVTEQDQRTPIDGAELRLSTSAGEFMMSAYTTSDGRFSFTSLKAGLYKIAVTAKGYDQSEQDVTMLSASRENLRIALYKSAGLKTDSASDGTISARELSLPPKAQEAMASGRNLLYDKHNATGSVPYFQQVTTIAPDFYEAYYEEGVAFTLQGQAADAETAFQKSVEISKDHYADPCFALASLLTGEKKYADAEKFARRGLEIAPDDWRGYYQLARVLVLESRLTEAQKNALEARTRNPDFAPTYLVLLNIHSRLFNKQAVLDDVNAYLKLEPSGPKSDQLREIKAQMEKELGIAPTPSLKSDHYQ
jgi:tetratricopeptide (TPR) repeat protein